jgi:hypothetical protein
MMDDVFADLTGIVSRDEVPLCPMCQNHIYNYELYALANVENTVCLVHYHCADFEFYDA